MDVAVGLVNTFILLVVLFYQRGKNKVLEDTMEAQRVLLEETRNLTLRQSSAIESQSTIVDAAMKYSTAFDLEKLEGVIAREAQLDYREEIASLRAQFSEALEGAKREEVDRLMTSLEEVIEIAAETAGDIVEPLMPLVLQALLAMPDDERVEALKDVHSEKLRGTILDGVRQVENGVRELPAKGQEPQ